MKQIGQIGSLKLKNRIFVAPMHEINDVAFRMLCKTAGASLTYTGLTNPQTREKIHLNDKPALQFACNSDKGIKEFIKKHDKKISLYDFNLGCPSHHAESSKVGYFMNENHKAIEKILKTIKESTKKPLTIKIRKMPLENTKKIIKIAEKYCDAVGVHPRTQPQGYSGIPDIEFAREIKKITKLPIIYSGNINTGEEAQKMIAEFDFIMIGRASMGNPSIFAELTKTELKNKITFQDWLKLAKKIEKKELYFSQIKLQALNFTKGFDGASQIRNKISQAKTEKEILSIMKYIKQ